MSLESHIDNYFTNINTIDFQFKNLSKNVIYLKALLSLNSKLKIQILYNKNEEDSVSNIKTMIKKIYDINITNYLVLQNNTNVKNESNFDLNTQHLLPQINILRNQGLIKKYDTFLENTSNKNKTLLNFHNKNYDKTHNKDPFKSRLLEIDDILNNIIDISA